MRIRVIQPFRDPIVLILQRLAKVIMIVAMYYGPTRIAARGLRLIKHKPLRVIFGVLIEPVIARFMQRVMAHFARKADEASAKPVKIINKS